MPDYSQGKVYKIVGNGKVYVGSTTRPLLSQRLASHRYKFKSWKNDSSPYYTTSFECLDDPECHIELLEMCPCNCRDELDRCEGKWIRETECINKNIAGRTQEEYRKENIELHKKWQKEWRDNNKEYAKSYYDLNKEKFMEAQRKYRSTKKIK